MSVSCDEYNDAYVEHTPRARKEHKCYACNETIRPGDRYRRTFVAFDGRGDSYKHCLRCAAMMDAIQEGQRKAGERDTGVALGLDCGHSWQEIMDEEPPPEIARLAFMSADDMQRELAADGKEGMGSDG